MSFASKFLEDVLAICLHDYINIKSKYFNCNQLILLSFSIRKSPLFLFSLSRAGFKSCCAHFGDQVKGELSLDYI